MSGLYPIEEDTKFLPYLGILPVGSNLSNNAQGEIPYVINQVN